MAKKIWEITKIIGEALKFECPNCGGKLDHRKSYELRCQDCGFDYYVETRNQRYFSLFILFGSLVFLAGFALHMAL